MSVHLIQGIYDHQTVCGKPISKGSDIRYTYTPDSTSCEECKSLVVEGALLPPDDPWRGLVVTATGEQLERIAMMMGITRKPGEPDWELRARARGVLGHQNQIK